MNAPGVGSPNPSLKAKDGSPSPKLPEGLSAFVARVLDQLSISAWLPAALAIAGIFFAIRMSIADGDVKDALEAVGGTSIEQLLVLLGAVVLHTTVTQAFEFGSIRFLEGYWGTARLPQWVADLFAGRWERWEKEARGRREELQLEAFRSAERRYANAIDDIDVVRHVHADLLDVASVPKLSSDQEELLNELDWRDYASARTMRRLEAHEKRMNRFPRSSRIMPTRLGNLLRASEDRANEEIPGSVQGMVHRTYHLVPGHLQVEIDQFRNRLGLYASLVVTELWWLSHPRSCCSTPGWRLPHSFRRVIYSSWRSSTGLPSVAPKPTATCWKPSQSWLAPPFGMTEKRFRPYASNDRTVCRWEQWSRAWSSRIQGTSNRALRRAQFPAVYDPP